MSIQEDPFGNLIDASTVIFTGLDDGILSIASGALQTAVVGDNLLYSDPTLSLNPTITGLVSLTSTTVNATNLDGVDANLDTAHIGDCYISGLLHPIGSVDVGASLSRFNNGHFAGTVSATSYNGTLLTSAQPNIALIGTQSTGLNISSGQTYKINAVDVLSATTLGSGVVNSSLTSLGVQATGVDVAAGYTYRINSQPVMYETGLGVGVLSSSLTSVGTLSGGLNIASGQNYRINAVGVLNATTLGSGVVNSSLTSIGTLAAGVNIATGQTYKVNGTAVLSSSTLGSGVTASSLTSLGNLSALNMAGNILPTSSFTRNIGSTTLKFEDIFANQINLYNNVNTGTTLTNQLNINGPAWSTSLDYGLSIGCPYSSTSPYHTAQESKINQFSTSGGSFGVAIGNVERNTAGATIADYSKNILAAYGKLGINHPSTSVPGFTIDAYGLDSSLVRISNSSLQDCLRLTQSGTNTILAVNSTLAGANNAYIDMCSNTPNTPCARLQAFNSSTTTSGLLRINVQNNTGVLTGLYDFDYVRFKPVSNNSLDLGQPSLIWRDIYAARLFNDTTNLAIGCNSATYLNVTTTALNPQTTAVTQLGTSSLLYNGVYSNSFANATLNAAACIQMDSTTKGSLVIPRMTETQRNAISSPITGLMVFNETRNRFSMYNNTAWRDVEYTPEKAALGTSTLYTSVSTGENLGGISLTVVAGQSGEVEVSIRGGTIYQTVATNAFFIGFSTTTGAQAYTAWDWGMASLNTTTGIFTPINFCWVKTGLTPGTSYTIYLKFGRIALSTCNVYSGGAVGESGITSIYARVR